MTPAVPRHRRIDLPGRGGSVAALELGSADRPIDIVFSHANSFNACTYRSILAPAAERMRILAYDLRGHGQTELPTVTEGRQAWRDFGEDLAALLEALDLKNVLLAGHSMGATACLLAAAEAPHRVRGLALFEPVIDAPGDLRDAAALKAGIDRVTAGALRRRARFPSIEAAMEAFVGRGAFTTWPREFVADFVEGGLRRLEDGEYELACTPEWEASNYATQPSNVWKELDLAPRPVRILRGAVWSSASILTERDRLEASGVSIETIVGTGHYLPMDRPDLVTETLLKMETSSVSG
jgi:pimeloyl-ACP methyl ester carboxylesterase